MVSLIIRGGEVLDGTGRPGFPADVGITEGKIAWIRRPGEDDDRQSPQLDASGCAVAPGFIDAHSHSDLTLPVHRGAESSLCQGITTEVAGSCGWSLAPVKAETARNPLRQLLFSLAGIKVGRGPGRMRWEWSSFGEYAAHLGRLGIGANLYPVIGQGLLRAHVVGLGKRPATSEELAAMRAMLREAMREGCRGLSTGRGYLPGRHADTAEIVALARELRRFGGLYTSHVKSESDGLLDAVREVIDIGRRSGVKVQVSHMKAIGPSHFGRVAEVLGLLERARESGVDVNCDAYPYDFAQVSMLRHSQFGFGPSSDPAHVMASLRDEAWRARLRKRLERGKSGFSQRADRLVLVAVRGRTDLNMVDLATAASREGREPLDFALDLLIGAELDVRVAARMSEDDVRQVLKHPLTMVGTDAFAIDGDPPTGLPLHPRHYGTFPRVLGHYARDLGLFGLPEAVYKMTGLPARKLGLSDRGTVAEGNWADLVVFDPRRVLDLATAAEPARRPAGIKAVLVNGEVAYQDGRPTGALGGKVLLRS